MIYRLIPLEQRSAQAKSKAMQLEQDREEYIERVDQMERDYLSAKQELEETLKSLETM
jgi:hypothetical protein